MAVAVLCLKFLDENKDKAFLLFLSHYAVHTPIQAKKNHVAKPAHANNEQQSKGKKVR